MSRPAIFRIKLGVRVPIVLGAISNLALAEVLSMFIRVLCHVLRCTLVGQKDKCGELKYFSSTMVKTAPLRQKTQAAAEAAACGFGMVHGDEIEIAADVYEHV